MKTEDFKEVEKELENAIDSVLKGGLKFKFRGPLINFQEKRDFKNIMKSNMKIEDKIKALKDHIEKHEVLTAQKDEFQAFLAIIKGLALLYHAQFVLLQDEYAHLQKERDEIKAAVDFFKKHGIPEPVITKIHAVIDKIMDEWEADFEEFRKEINAVWSRAKGGAGWALGAFEATKNQGYWMRRNERTKLNEALKSGAIVDADLKKLTKVKTQKEMDKLLNEIAVNAKVEIEDYEAIEKMLFSTWDSITKDLKKITGIVYKGATGRELPVLDKTQTATLADMIVNKVDEHFLHALRTDENQLEGLLKETEAEEEGLKKVS